MTKPSDPRDYRCDQVRVQPRTEVKPRPEENEVVSFTHFQSFGFGVPVHPLLRWLLYYYGLCLHDLTLEGILHLSVFIMLCEVFLGVPTHYELWQSLFRVVRSALGRVHLPRMGAMT